MFSADRVYVTTIWDSQNVKNVEPQRLLVSVHASLEDAKRALLERVNESLDEDELTMDDFENVAVGATGQAWLVMSSDDTVYAISEQEVL